MKNTGSLTGGSGNHRPTAGLPDPLVWSGQTVRSTISFLILEMANAGFNPFGHVLAQFMIV